MYMMYIFIPICNSLRVLKTRKLKITEKKRELFLSHFSNFYVIDISSNLLEIVKPYTVQLFPNTLYIFKVFEVARTISGRENIEKWLNLLFFCYFFALIFKILTKTSLKW